MTTPKGERSSLKSKKTASLDMLEIFPNLTQDLITEILVRLPVKSIGQFKCVSKPCRSFLSSPQFIKSHLKFNVDDSDGLICGGWYTDLNLSILVTLSIGSTSDGDDDGFCRDVHFPFLNSADFLVKGSCHGLVLLQLLNNSDRSDPLIVVNPITLGYVNVPECQYAMWCMYGLGYNSSKDDYKVIALPRLSDLGGRFVYVYSLKTKNWKKVGNNPPVTKGISYFKSIFDTSFGVFVNGRMHWLYSDSRIANSHHRVLDAFNLTSDKFEEIPLPSGIELGNKGGCCISFLGGYLALIQYFYKRMDVWLMKKYGVQDSWTKLTIICPEVGNIWDLVCLLSEDEIILKNVDDCI